MSLLLLIMLPGGSISFPMDDEETRPEEVAPEESSLIRLARLSDDSSRPEDFYSYLDDDDIPEDVDDGGGSPRDSETKDKYTKIPEDPPFLGKSCETNKDCYKLFGKSLECSNATSTC